MARILIVAGGCRGRSLASELVREGQLVTVTTRTEAGRRAIESSGARCLVATPMQIGTLRGALDGLTLACWLLAQASGTEQELRDLHGSRLELFLTQLIDTTVRGILYDATRGAVPDAVLAEGERTVRSQTQLNAIPARVVTLEAMAGDGQARWIAAARESIAALLTGPV